MPSNDKCDNILNIDEKIIIYCILVTKLYHSVTNMIILWTSMIKLRYIEY